MEKYSYMDAIIWYCEEKHYNRISWSTYSVWLKEKIQVEASKQNLIKVEATGKLV